MASTLKRISEFTSDRVMFKGQGVSGTVTAGQTGNVDYRITEERLITGLQMILSNHAAEDHCGLQVADVDNLLGYGAGFVLSEFASSWYVDAGQSGQGQFHLPYLSSIPAGFYLRVVYTSTGGSDVTVRMNYFLHKPLV